MATTTTTYSYPLIHSREEIMSIDPYNNSPGSPPELTNSKSSKSSSFHSSSLSDAAPHDLAHFEDITLDDVQGDVYMRKMTDSQDAAAITKHRPNSSARMAASSTPSLNHGRELTGVKAQHVQVARLAEKKSPTVPQMQMSLGLPPKMQKRRKSKGGPGGLLTNLHSAGKRSRSISPVSPKSGGSSPRMPAGWTPRPGPDAPIHIRRSSWQPGKRKTVQELEDEYHDSDEDLPEDAVIWNVPISPRPPQERQKSPSPRQLSPRHSYVGGPLSPGSDGLGLDFSSSGNPMNVGKAPKSPRLSSLPRTVSMTSIPEDYSLNPRSGGKTWDATLSDLSAEARMLTQVLEEHAEDKEKEAEHQVQSGQSSPSKQRSPKRTVSASSIELPPMRRGELMIDPLPVSKEKEKFLTRTRPSWLPPKDPEEEKRHLKEYQKMMAQAKLAEEKKAKKQQQDMLKRDDSQDSLAKAWEQNILPNWEERINDPKSRELWWQGITPRDRGAVWQKAVGNELGLTESSYELALKRAKDAEAKLAAMTETERDNEMEWKWFEAIKGDVREAFPELKIFQPGGPLHETLIEVCMAYAMYRSDVGYVHGVHCIAALLILNLSGPTSFITLANLLNRGTPSAFLQSTAPAMQHTFDSVLFKLHKQIPDLHAHLTNPKLELNAAEYLQPMLTPLFASNKFGLDIVSRIWDVYVFEGDDVLAAACCATLAKLEGKLYGSREEVLDVLASEKSLNLGKDDDFMTLVRSFMGGKAEEQTGEGAKRPSSW